MHVMTVARIENFERVFDRFAPALFLGLGFLATAAVLVLGS
jgi:hypothetical protein